jgi:hypothetical protein
MSLLAGERVILTGSASAASSLRLHFLLVWRQVRVLAHLVALVTERGKARLMSLSKLDCGNILL